MRHFVHHPILLLTFLSLVLGTGCAGRPAPAVLPETLPRDWSCRSCTADVQDLAVTATLLDLLDEPRVTELVTEALANNPDIRATAARLNASGFLLSQTGARRLPEVSAGADRTRNNHSADDAGNPTPENTYRVSATVSWELDVWGRISDRHQARVFEHDALALDYDRAYDALAARVIQAWVNGVAARRILAIEKERLDALQKIENALLHRYRQGLGSLQDYSAARTRTEVARSGVSDRTRAFRNALRDLEVLVGRYPKADDILGASLPEIAPPAALPPESALKNRPDIRAALARIDAGRLTALSAEKNRLPALRLVAELSKSSRSLSDLDTGSRLWSLAAGLTQPLFNGGRLKDEALARAAQADAAVYDLAFAVLSAVKEVETALDRETTLTGQERAMKTAVREAVKTTEYFRTRYRNGLDNIQTLLIAQEQEMNIKANLIDIRAARMANRIDMALALGLGLGV